MVGCRSTRLNQNKPFSGPVSTLMSSSAEFYSFSLSGRLRAVGLNALESFSTNDESEYEYEICKQVLQSMRRVLNLVLWTCSTKSLK